MTISRMTGLPRSFKALALGELLAGQSWKGAVLSIHKRALYILRGDDLAVSIVADDGSMTAMSVLVPPLFSVPVDESLVGRASLCTRSRILLEDFADIDIAACATWSGRVARCEPSSREMDVLDRLTKALRKYGKSGGLLGVLSSAPGAEREPAHVAAARQALQAGSLGALVGLGPGLTPAGDDFLAGAQLAVAICRPERAGSLTIDFGQIRAAFAGTTPAGRTLLWMALQGCFPALFRDFANSFNHASDAELDAAVREACAYGGSSGTDGLAGFCWMAARLAHAT